MHSYRVADQNKILKAIENTVGIEKINQATLDPLRKWLLETATFAVATKANPELYRGLGVLRFELGKLKEAKEALEQGIQLRKQYISNLRSSNSLDFIEKTESLLAEDYTNLASCEMELGFPEIAIDWYHQAVDIRLKLHDDSHVAVTFNNQGLAFKSLHHYSSPNL